MSVLAVAHRAGNSLAGLHAANLLGVDVVECDVHAHRGRLEVRHLRTAGPLPFLWDRWELVPASAPRLGLEELLQAGLRGATVMLDLKGRTVDVGVEVARLLHDRAHVDDVLVCGRTWAAVDRAAARRPGLRRVLSARTRRELAALLRRLDDDVPYGVSLHASLVTSEVARRVRRRAGVLMTWPVDDDTTLDRVVAAGANAVISDEPDVLRRVLADR